MTIEQIKPSLAEAGKIKIGELGEERTSKAGNKWRRPKKLDYFRVTRTTRDASGNFAEDTSIMGELPLDEDGKCRRIPVQLPFDDPAANFATAYAAYSGKTLACHGDGLVAIRHKIEGGKRTGATKRVECPCDYLDSKKCKPTGRLSVMIDLPGHRTLGAAHVWRTTSRVSISQMEGSMQTITAALGGRLAGHPMWLVLVEIHNERGNFWCCHLELRESDIGTRVAIGAVDAAPMPTIDALPESTHAEIAEEFYPEAEKGPYR